MKLTLREADEIYRGNLLWLLVAQAAAIIPLLFYMPLWITAVWLVAVGWRLQIHRRVMQFPSMLVKLTLALGSIAAIYASYAGRIGAEPMVAFLVCSFVMKLVEMRSRKDALIILFIAFIAIATQFLFAQDLSAGLYALGSLFVLLTAWLAVFQHGALPVRRHFKNGAVFMLQALPLMMLLFVVMPRLGPLWSVPVAGEQGRSGFTDTLELGDIGNLVLSSEVAFRVSFDGEVPRSGELYWRGLILDQFDGIRWSRSRHASGFARLDRSSTPQANTLDYSIILEPHRYRWLFSLGRPLAGHSSQLTMFLTSHDLLFAEEPVRKKVEYQVVSSRTLSLEKLEEHDFRRYTDLPPVGNPRARQMAENWKREQRSADGIVNAALDYFADNFLYTLRSTTGAENAIDTFLFDSQEGFCEHFASSFVFLMRSAGIPARLVMGYQGGEWNPGVDYFMVRQSDAHAWAEIWVEDRGWTRIDPTASVAPDRIDFGVQEALGDDDLALINSPGRNRAWMRVLMQRWDSLGYSWNRWVLNYDTTKRTGVLERLLGGADPWRIGVVVAIAFSLVIMPLLFLHWRQTRKRYLFTEDKLSYPLIKRLTDRGLIKLPSESTAHYLRRAADVFSAEQRILLELADAYEHSVYSRQTDSDNLLQLLKQTEKCTFRK